MSHGLLLFAHGARDPHWARPFEAVVMLVRRSRPEFPVALGFLEFMSPNLIEAGDELANSGCTHVAVVPLFLGAGGHVRKDLPALLQQLRQAHAEIDWRLQPAIGEIDSVVQAMADAVLALSDSPTGPASDSK